MFMSFLDNRSTTIEPYQFFILDVGIAIRVSMQVSFYAIGISWIDPSVKGKPSESWGRKVTGLQGPVRPRIAGLPGSCCAGGLVLPAGEGKLREIRQGCDKRGHV